MLARLKGAALFGGFRGAAGVDSRSRRHTRAGFGVCRRPGGNIAELDINPIICSAERLIAVDALIVRAKP